MSGVVALRAASWPAEASLASWPAQAGHPRLSFAPRKRVVDGRAKPGHDTGAGGTALAGHRIEARP